MIEWVWKICCMAFESGTVAKDWKDLGKVFLKIKDYRDERM